MCTKKNLRIIPTILVVAFLLLGGMLKISEYHPMLHHLVEMGLYPYVRIFGAMEIIFAILFLFDRTSRLGLLLLTAYFGGAVAMEIPYQMILAPAIPLSLIWLSAWLRQPAQFFTRQQAI